MSWALGEKSAQITRDCTASKRGMDKKQSLKLHERKQNLFLSPVLLCENCFGHVLNHNHEIVGWYYLVVVYTPYPRFTCGGFVSSVNTTVIFFQKCTRYFDVFTGTQT